MNNIGAAPLPPCPSPRRLTIKTMIQARRILIVLCCSYGAIQMFLYLVFDAMDASSSSAHQHRRGLMELRQTHTFSSLKSAMTDAKPYFGVGVSVHRSRPMPLLRGAGTMACKTPANSACSTGIDMGSATSIWKQRQDRILEVREKQRENGNISTLLPSPPRSQSSPSLTSEVHDHEWPRLSHSLEKSPINIMIDRSLSKKLVLPLGKRISAPDNRTIYFLHIHKAAGTLLCATARANKLNVTNTNCNVQKDQRCCGGDDSLEAQHSYAQTRAYDLVANERDMYTAMDTSLYRYIVVLRESQTRYRSHWKNMCRERNDTTTTFHSWWTRQPDNWIVRKICGTRCMGIPKYHLTDDDFEYTLDRLRLFDDVMFMERFNETYQTFAKHVGWMVPPPEMRSYDSKFPYAEDEVNDLSWDPLMSALDDALYEYATGLYEAEQQPPRLGKTSMWKIREYLADGPNRMCTTECCHHKCSAY